MIQLEGARLAQLIVHRVGAKKDAEGVILSAACCELGDDSLQKVLFEYFVDSFKWEDFYQFTHHTDLALNEIRHYCGQVFQQPTPEHFVIQSAAMVNHLYGCSTHPNIKRGEVYVAYFEDCLFDDELVNAVGIFKSEQRTPFLQLRQADGRLHLQLEEGIFPKKLDKGAMVFNTAADDGYRIAVVDMVNQADARYWKDDFLRVALLQGDAFKTKAYLGLCKEYAKKVIAKNGDAHEQAQFIGESLEYFEQRETFDFLEFVETIFPENEEKKEAFVQYKAQYEAKNGVEGDEQFPIVRSAFDQAKKKLQTLIRLDTNIDLKLNSNAAGEPPAKFLEKGFDEKRGMKYYKVYYNQEL